ncbi:MAG: ABC transporter permease [Polyangiales bacterium]
MSVEARRSSLLSLVAAVARAQLQLSRHQVEDFMPVLSMPLVTLVSTAILVHSGRRDLADHAVVASLLMTVGQMGLFVGTQVISMDRTLQTLELAVVSPQPYVLVLATRIFLLTLLGLLGFLEGWGIAWWVFDVHVTLHWPALFLASVFVTTLALTGTCLVTAALCSLSNNPRTFQHALNGPLYLLGGVLVPVTFLPEWLQPLSRGVFFYWAAALMRDAFRPAAPLNVVPRLAAVLGLGAAAAVIGAWLMRRVFDHLRREGRLGLS